jgi:hypothetical protein
MKTNVCCNIKGLLNNWHSEHITHPERGHVDGKTCSFLQYKFNINTHGHLYGKQGMVCGISEECAWTRIPKYKLNRRLERRGQSLRQYMKVTERMSDGRAYICKCI